MPVKTKRDEEKWQKAKDIAKDQGHAEDCGENQDRLSVRLLAKAAGYTATERISGIYLILNTSNSKKYVGKSQHIFSRWRAHLKTLRNGIHPNPHLQRAWQKYGEESFTFLILEEAGPDLLGVREACLIRHFSSGRRESGYNLVEATPEGHRMISEETRAKMRASQKAAWVRTRDRRIPAMLASGHLEALRQGNVGRSASPETKARMSQSHLGRPQSEAHKKARADARRGWIPSSETRAKIGAAHKGRRASQETRAKMSESQSRRFREAPHAL
jgi:group I intron endonuclease